MPTAEWHHLLESWQESEYAYFQNANLPVVFKLVLPLRPLNLENALYLPKHMLFYTKYIIADMLKMYFGQVNNEHLEPQTYFVALE